MRLFGQDLLTERVPIAQRWLFLAQTFTVFFTGVKILPGIRNNFGPFEVIGGALVVAFLFAPGRSAHLRGHPIVRIQAAIAILALLSLLWFESPNLSFGAVQCLILVFQLLFVLVTYNFMVTYQIGPEKLLRLVTYAALVIGPWILLVGLGSESMIQDAGPFRNRAHMANYMLTAFWLVLLFNVWPGIRKRDRLISYLALASTIYPIAIAGRRSVYLSLLIGLAGVGLSFLVASRGRRRAAFAAALVIFVFLGTLYAVGPRWMPQLGFFRDRVSGIGDRLELAVGNAEEGSQPNFFRLQRAGVTNAFLDHPLLGIGWGAYYKSSYTFTSHEVHSTPLRFLAELGLIGFGLYLTLMGVLLLGSLRILALLFRTPYRTPAVVLAIALWSLSVSYVYNRHITERTFWLLLAFYLVFEAFARSVAAHTRRAQARAAAAARPLPPRRAAAAMARVN